MREHKGRKIELVEQQSGGSSNSDDMEPKIIRAAEYVRMSTEHQQYSTENQGDAIREYAERHQMKIVRTYSDAGKSGLKIEGRDALRQLIDDVEGGETDFDAILVYDISRWGRFQDADESAYYEYICRRKAFLFIIAPSSSTMTAVRSRPSSRASNAPWPANIAASSQRRSLRVSAASLSSDFAKAAWPVMGSDGCGSISTAFNKAFSSSASTKACRPTV
jgi:hypothetical protein